MTGKKRVNSTTGRPEAASRRPSGGRRKRDPPAQSGIEPAIATREDRRRDAGRPPQVPGRGPRGAGQWGRWARPR